MNLTFSAELRPGDEFVRLFTEHHQFVGKITDRNNGYVRIVNGGYDGTAVVLRESAIIAVAMSKKPDDPQGY